MCNYVIWYTNAFVVKEKYGWIHFPDLISILLNSSDCFVSIKFHFSVSSEEKAFIETEFVIWKLVKFSN